MKKAFLIFCASWALFASAQERYQVAVFSPLFLDSAFDASSQYRHGKNLPKYFNSGLEFYEGVQMAIDTLKKENFLLDVFVYDTRSPLSTVNALVNNRSFDSIDLVIGNVNAAEARTLANAVARKNIPFINVTFPNDAGVAANPNFVVMNSTLQTHFAAIYKFIQRNYALAPVVMFTQKGPQEKILREYFEDIAKNTSSVSLKIRFVSLDNQFTADDLRKHLEEGVTSVILGGSLNVDFAAQLVQNLSTIRESHPAVLFGMPTWWDATNFSGPEYRGVDVFYSTAFYLSPLNPFVEKAQAGFRSRYFTKPTDNFYRGYEAFYHFAHLLRMHGKNLSSNFSDKRFLTFTNPDIQPVLNPKTNTLDYFENKKIYFVKKVDGITTAIY